MLVPLLIVGGIGAAVYFGTRKTAVASAKPEHQPAPQAPGAQPQADFGPRFQKYMDQIDKAAKVFKAAKSASSLIGLPWTGAALELKGTLDVVSGMADNDVLSGAITENDHKALKVAIDKTKALL